MLSSSSDINRVLSGLEYIYINMAHMRYHLKACHDTDNMSYYESSLNSIFYHNDALIRHNIFNKDGDVG